MKIKSVYSIALVATCFVASNCAAQPILSSKAFNRMITDFFNFSLLGSKTPSTGFKFETNKPSIALKGNIFSTKNRSVIVNLELEGGLDDGVMQLVSGKDVSGYFKSNLGINYLLPFNKAKHFKIYETEKNINAHAFNVNRVKLSRQLDSFLIIKTILDDAVFRTYSFSQLLALIKGKRNALNRRLSTFSKIYQGDEDSYYSSLICAILVNYGARADAVEQNVLNSFKVITSTIAVNDTTLKSLKILKDYDRLKEELYTKEKLTIKDKQSDFEIETTKVLWTRQNITWINLSFTGSNTSFKLYDRANNNLADEHSLLKGITLSYNWLTKATATNQFVYLKAGLTYQRVNNLVDLKKIDYKKETLIASNPGEQLTSTKEGTAYEGALMHKRGVSIAGEAYVLPWKYNFVPGFYLKCEFSNSSIWINKNKLQGDIGLVWNVNNNDKDAKNLLTIIPYVSWSNFLKEYKDADKTETKKLSSLFSFGVKFGVPVNLGK